ncbi:MAG: hypothetical protein KJ667_09860 [Alphaproteobacteria bacterium]|nr:hypothetical protein [Alphaproteobacteria bacterium]
MAWQGIALGLGSLTLNDGAVAYRDLSYRSPSNTYDFLKSSWALFNNVNKMDKSLGHGGCRMVIATGFRVKGSKRGIEDATGKLRSVIRRLGKGLITADEAIEKAKRIRQYSDIVPQLQANFAFTKAYVAERSGTKGGLSGARCFVDLSLFDKTVGKWIQLGEKIKWDDKTLNLSANFSPIIHIGEHVHPYPSDIRSGLEIAQQLAGDKDVLRALRKAAK